MTGAAVPLSVSVCDCNVYLEVKEKRICGVGVHVRSWIGQSCMIVVAGFSLVMTEDIWCYYLCPF